MLRILPQESPPGSINNRGLRGLFRGGTLVSVQGRYRAWTYIQQGVSL